MLSKRIKAYPLKKATIPSKHKSWPVLMKVCSRKKKLTTNWLWLNKYKEKRQKERRWSRARRKKRVRMISSKKKSLLSRRKSQKLLWMEDALTLPRRKARRK